MKNRLKLIRMIGILTGFSIFIIFIQIDHKIKKINEINDITTSIDVSDPLALSGKIVTMRGEIVEIYDESLILKSAENSLLYEASIPQTELLHNWALGDIVTVSYNGRQLDTSPAILLGVISIETDAP